MGRLESVSTGFNGHCVDAISFLLLLGRGVMGRLFATVRDIECQSVGFYSFFLVFFLLMVLPFFYRILYFVFKFKGSIFQA